MGRDRGVEAPSVPVGPALRLIRGRLGLDQSEIEARGGPSHGVISNWENGRKIPSLTLLAKYLVALELDFHDLQDALDQITQSPGGLRRRVVAIERRLSVLERGE